MRFKWYLIAAGRIGRVLHLQSAPTRTEFPGASWAAGPFIDKENAIRYLYTVGLIPAWSKYQHDKRG